VLLLSLFGALLYIGTLVAPLLGVVADRIGHRNLLCAMRGFYTTLAATLLALAFAGALSPLVVFCLAGLMGLVRPSALGLRWALVAHTVPADQLVGAMGFSRTTTDGARVMGALAGAGLFAGFGIGPAYVVVTGLYGAGLWLLLTIGEPAPADGGCGVRPLASSAESLRGGLREGSEPVLRAEPPAAGGLTGRPAHLWRDLTAGLVLVWSTPALLASILLAVLVNLLAFPLSNQLLPYVARKVYGVDQTGLGLLTASFAVGGLMGSLAVSARRGIAPGRTMVVSCAVWFACLLAFAQMQTLWSGAAALALAGLAQSLCMVTLAVVLLDVAGETFRGRIMGVRMLAIYSLPLGALTAGALIDAVGFRAMATLYTLAGLALTLAIALHWRAHLWRVSSAEVQGGRGTSDRLSATGMREGP
jgi:predicted MFS family arabinose efflux permease